MVQTRELHPVPDAPDAEDESARRPYVFVLDSELVARARRQVGETEVVRSIEAALEAAVDYRLWRLEVASGERDILS